jgi:hypothetical protein
VPAQTFFFSHQQLRCPRKKSAALPGSNRRYEASASTAATAPPGACDKPDDSWLRAARHFPRQLLATTQPCHASSLTGRQHTHQRCLRRRVVFFILFSPYSMHSL